MRTWKHLALSLTLAAVTAFAQPRVVPTLPEGAESLSEVDVRAAPLTGSKRKSTPAPQPKPGTSGGKEAGKRFPQEVKDAAEKEAGGKCVFCGQETTREPGPSQRNTDHAVPKSRDGAATLDNAQNTCRTCNLEKGAETTQEYLEKK